jgi:hypothetical protein
MLVLLRSQRAKWGLSAAYKVDLVVAADRWEAAVAGSLMYRLSRSNWAALVAEHLEVFLSVDPSTLQGHESREPETNSLHHSPSDLTLVQFHGIPVDFAAGNQPLRWFNPELSFAKVPS